MKYQKMSRLKNDFYENPALVFLFLFVADVADKNINIYIKKVI